jgi:hypothetical protein
MSDYDYSSGVDAHKNGTIWAAALWDLRERLRCVDFDAPKRLDLNVLMALVLLGSYPSDQKKRRVREVCHARERYGVALAALIEADCRLYSGLHRELIVGSFARRGIRADTTFMEKDDHPTDSAENLLKSFDC